MIILTITQIKMRYCLPDLNYHSRHVKPDVTAYNLLEKNEVHLICCYAHIQKHICNVIQTQTHIFFHMHTYTHTHRHRHGQCTQTHTHTDTSMHTDTRPGQIHMLMYLGNGCHGNNFNIAMVINL